MNKQGMAFFTDLHLPLIGLILFFSLFVILTWVQVRRPNKNEIDHLQNLPLEGE